MRKFQIIRNRIFSFSNRRSICSETRYPLKRSSRLPVYIKKHPEAIFKVHGVISFESYQGNRSPVSIVLGPGAHLEIFGDLIIGSGTSINVCKNAKLSIGGKLHESGSGFTENVKIMVARKVTIGHDLICAWNVFITDCDWHDIEGVENISETTVGDHVWITPNCSILKGCSVGSNSIVTNGSVLSNSKFDDYSLIAGSPARRLGQARDWSRDLTL